MNSADNKALAMRQQQGEKSRARRPMVLDLRQIAGPVGALTLIGHRVVPAAVCVFALSLQREAGFERWTAIPSHPALKVAAVLAIWALAPG
jgi:hypothetical protein